MNEENFYKIFSNDEIDSKWEGDNALQGLDIIRKHYDITKENIIEGAGHDELWSVDIEKLCKRGITEDDVIKLKKLNWTERDGYLFCFV